MLEATLNSYFSTIGNNMVDAETYNLVIFFIEYKTILCLHEILYLASGFMKITNESMELGFSNLVRR